MSLADRIHRILRGRQGAEQAVSAPELCRLLGLPQRAEREVRQAIEDAAPRWPDLICAIPGKGFFVAVDLEEAERYDNWLKQLADAALAKRSAFLAACARKGIRLNPPVAAAAA